MTLARAALYAAIALGAATVTACSSDPRSAETKNVGTITLPLSTTVGSSTYRLDAVFTITGDEGSISLTTKGDEQTLSTTLQTGAYDIVLESFTLSKDDGTGTFAAVPATVLTKSLPFTITAQATTTVAFHFLTEGATVVPGTGDLDVTFDVTEAGCTPISVDPTARTVTSARFFLDFSNAVANDPEDLDVIRWAGGANLVQSLAVDACTSNIVQYFGNSWAPPDPNAGGLVLVGSGSTGTWQQDGADSIVIHSTSAGCSASETVPVETHYRFREGIGANTIEVERHFDLSGTSLDNPIRPFIPRLGYPFDRVLHPNAAGTSLLSEDVFACFYGCQIDDWDGSWFAYYASSGPFAGQGMIVRRQLSALPAKLLVDADGGAIYTNASSILLQQPAGGFPPTVTEKELFCFFDSQLWPQADQSALKLPDGCTLGLACNASAPCQPNPCQHGGVCSNDNRGGYTCQCPPGINGTNCDIVFTELESAFTSSCGIRADGEMSCFGPNSFAGQWPSSDTFEAMSMSAGTLCAVHTGGAAECWYQNTPDAQPPDLPFTSLTTSVNGRCGILNDGTINCWGSYDFYFPPPPTGTFQALSMGNFHVCALGTDQTLTCWTLDDGEPAGLAFGQSHPPAGTFLSVRSGITASCGLRTDHTIACWGATSNGTPLVPPSGTFIALDYRADYGCAIRTDHTLACWGVPTIGGENIPPPGTYTALATGDYHPCAISTDGSVVCWGSYAGPGFEQPPSGQP
jgi:hypothetical protein